ncbi:MAG: Inner rane component of cytoplasmic domain, partial [Acidobacteriota bacterium]|nr:Inner rane component of cytoplasmic domain [Acidobacteriota bacterium]
MPLIRCPKCGQAYDVPGVVAVRLPDSIAACRCGEWLAGSKAAVLARLLNPEEIREIDLAAYRVDIAAGAPAMASQPRAEEPPARPRSVRIVARGAKQSVSTVFTIHEHPLWIGRKGCHVELADSELSIRHCSISLRGDRLVVRDADSHMGTYLDGEAIEEKELDDGVHLLRVGTALVTIEPTEERGTPVEPIALDTATLDEASLAQKLQARARAAGTP